MLDLSICSIYGEEMNWKTEEHIQTVNKMFEATDLMKIKKVVENCAIVY